MTFLNSLFVQKGVAYYRQFLGLIRSIPEGLFYALSILCIFIIGWAGANNAPFENIESAFEIFLWLHFSLCVRLGISVTGDVKPLSKIVWLIGLTSICIAILNKVFAPSDAEFMKLCAYLFFLVVVFFYIGWIFSMFGEKIEPRQTPPTPIERALQLSVIITGVVYIPFSHPIGTYIANTIRDSMGVVV